ncbi:MAG TPA: hypothetical protein VF418_14385 [Sphingomonadaceae bacterium]
MTDWRAFLSIAGEHLRKCNRNRPSEWSSAGSAPARRTWCSWTTFDRLVRDAGYWTAELPDEGELGADGTADFGVWDQPFSYSSIAHVVIPREFLEEQSSSTGYFAWIPQQDIDGLSEKLKAAGIEHRASRYALEIKLY